MLQYQYEPKVGAETRHLSADSSSEQDSELSSSDEEIDHEFEGVNAWRLRTLSWRKCGHCTISNKVIEFLLPRESVGVRRIRGSPNQTEIEGKQCLTTHREFNRNMLSERVLKSTCAVILRKTGLLTIKIWRKYKLYRLVAYQRCSRGIF